MFEIQRRLTHADRQEAATALTLAQPVLLHAILAEAPASDHATLQRVAKSWCHAINQPEMWQKRFGPAVICRASSSLYVSFRPRSENVAGDFPIDNPPLMRSLGTFAGKMWHLRTGAVADAAAQVRHKALLDSATLLRLSPRLAITPAELSLLLATSRGETLSFLLDRAYRIAHNMPSRVYRVDSENMVAALCVLPCLMGAVIFAAAKAWSLQNIPSGLAATVVVTAAVWKLAVLGQQLQQDVAADGRAMLHNMRYGHARARQLNGWAIALAADQGVQAAPPSVSGVL